MGLDNPTCANDAQRRRRGEEGPCAMEGTRPSVHVLRVALVSMLVVVVAGGQGAHIYGGSRPYGSKLDQDNLIPKFEDTPTYIQAIVGQTVYLPCNVANLDDKVVSWIRTSDLSILTSDLHTFTSDGRFGVLHAPGSRAWNLRVMGAQRSDEGQYECQVNTDPKINRPVFLRIGDSSLSHDRPFRPYNEEGAGGAPGPPEPPAGLRQAKIVGAAERFVSPGSTVTFTCFVSAPYPRGHPPHSVLWLHRGALVSIQGERGGISLSTVSTGARTTSRLTVAQVGPADAGNYTCEPGSGIAPAAVALVLTDGERTEAMQRDGLHSGAACTAGAAALLVLPLLVSSR